MVLRLQACVLQAQPSACQCAHVCVCLPGFGEPAACCCGYGLCVRVQLTPCVIHSVRTSCLALGQTGSSEAGPHASHGQRH
jgi:hypothetical protein